jgi:hypothetical protein
VSDFDLNLQVFSEHLNDLSAGQQTGADKITGANRAVVDVAKNVQDSHGLICWATGLAMGHVDDTRKSAGETTYRVSCELVTKLNTALTNYENIDYREGRSLGEMWNA